MASSRDSGHALRMTVRRANVYFDELFRKFARRGIVMSMDYDIRSGDGITSDGALNGDGSARVGASELKMDRHNWFGARSISDQLFVKTLVSVYHELRHADIFALIQDGKKCPEGVLLSHMSRQGSSSYYVFNRYRMAHEIDAEFNGVVGAYHRLVSLCGEAEANGLVCEYVNWQCEHNSYYVEQPDVDGVARKFESVSEISEAFFESYELSTSVEPVVRDSLSRPLESGRYKEVRTSWQEDAALSSLLRGGVLRPECRPVFDAIWDAGNGNKDRMMASLSLHFMPKLRSFYGDAVCDALSLERVFGTEIARCVPSSESTGVENRCIEPIGGSFLSDDGKQGGGFEMSV